MSYKILEKNGIEIENVDGAEFNNFVSGGKNLIFKDVLNECRLIKDSSRSIILSTGVIIIQGVRIKILQEQVFTLSSTPASNESYQIVAEISLSGNRNVSFSLFVQLESASLQKDLLYTSENGIYQVEVGRFDFTSEGNIQNLTTTLETSYATNESDDFSEVLEEQNEKIAEVEKIAQEALDKANNAASVYRPQGSLSSVSLLPEPSIETLGFVYNIINPFFTTDKFLEGAGKYYSEGTNIVIVEVPDLSILPSGKAYKYDVLSGFVDLSGYQTKIVGEVIITADQLTSYNDLRANITLTVEQMSVFLNSNIVNIDATVLGKGSFVVYRGESVDDYLIYTEAKTDGAYLNITVSQRVVLYVYNNLKFENQSADNVIYNGTYNSLLDGVERYRLADNRIAETTTADAGKYLTVDSSGNIVWASLPIYNGETETPSTGFNVTYKAGSEYFSNIPSCLDINLTFADGTTANYYIRANVGPFPTDWQEQTGEEPDSGVTGNGYTWRNVVSITINASAPYAPDSGPYIMVNKTNVGKTYTTDLTEDITIYSDGGEF